MRKNDKPATKCGGRHGTKAGWREKIYKADPYVPGEQQDIPGLIKLNTNENPFPPPQEVENAIHRFQTDRLRKYPPTDTGKLRDALAEAIGTTRTQIFVGNGSDEVLALAFRTCFNSDKPVLFPDITYSFYPVWCRFFGIPYEEIPLDEDFRIRANEYARDNGGIVIANPNAPTGIAESREFIEYLLQANSNSVVIVDEAYVSFGASTAVPLVDRYDNLQITRSFSKIRSLAGIRLGLAYGSRPLIEALEGVKDSFNSYTVNSISIEAGFAATKERAYYQIQTEKIMRIRYQYMERLRALGFTVLDSKANFLFATHPEIPAKDLYEYLKSNLILVRHFNKPRIDNFLRISIGTEDEMRKLLERVTEYVNQNNAHTL
jgi:histidinol-phosphate aminotransferase